MVRKYHWVVLEIFHAPLMVRKKKKVGNPCFRSTNQKITFSGWSHVSHLILLKYNSIRPIIGEQNVPFEEIRHSWVNKKQFIN